VTGATISCDKVVATTERLTKADPANVVWQTDLVVGLIKISLVSDPPDACAAYERALAILELLARDGKLTAVEQRWPQLIRGALEKLPK
jgi:hypothetical protein